MRPPIFAAAMPATCHRNLPASCGRSAPGNALGGLAAWAQGREGLLHGRFADRPPEGHGRFRVGDFVAPAIFRHEEVDIQVGEAGEEYPGDRVVEVKTRDFCSDSVGAWLNYPVDYDYGYTWFHEAEWEAGNRRSVCWAATTA